MAPEVKSKHRHSRCRGIVQIKFDHKTNVQKKTKKMNDTEMRQHAIAITGITDEDFDKALERVKLDPETDTPNADDKAATTADICEDLTAWEDRILILRILGACDPEVSVQAYREVLDLAYRYPGNAHSWAYLAKTLDKLV